MALGSVRRTSATMALAGLLSASSGCATQATQKATHLATPAALVTKADHFTKNTSHILENLELIKQSGMLTPEQIKSLTAVASSNPEELVEATKGAVFAMNACKIADAQCAENARPVCTEFKENIFECPAYTERCDGVLQKCAKYINKYIVAVTDFLRSEALPNATK